ncbi:tRNA ligase, partial [Phenoliferia sp. Uapishka_3]
MKPSIDAPSPTTELVRALYSFGHLDSPEEHPDLDEEEEELTVGGLTAQSKSSKPEVAETKGKGKVKVKGGNKNGKTAEGVTSELEKLDVKKKEPASAKSLKGLLRSSTHTIQLPAEEEGGQAVERVLTSWKMADYAYKRDPCPFPTRARGLFTEKVGGDGTAEEYKIVARGYDKFFNVNEVSWTQWDAIPKHSSPPYELTHKSNGCIILISTLSPRHILVTSKHSIGANSQLSTENGQSHSQRGEYWLEKHLAVIGKTKEDLAAVLHERQLTAVAELCDDSFEEHVLAYPDHLTGLHLHGLNTNTPLLHTLSSTEVSAFAKTWGLIPTPYSIFPSVIAVKTYCANVEADGGVEEVLPSGQTRIVPVEGFVVRGVKKGGSSDDGRPAEPFFWKVKYDQPYLMYREWRELTRKLLASYPESDVKPGKLKTPESRMYLWWVNREIQKDVERFEPWKVGKGIIRTRNEFLDWMKSKEAKEVAKQLKQDVFTEENAAKGEFDRTLLVPVAVQGCGKTSLALSLSRLFDWGHTQSDDFIQKKSGPHFVKSVRDLLATKSVVIADKNNHIRKLRSDLVNAAHALSPAHRVRLVALVWPIDSPELPRDKLHEIFASRIVSRGQNHQTLRAGEGHESAIWQFFGQHEKFDQATNKEDGEFDEVIELNPSWSKMEMLTYVVDQLVPMLGLERPTTQQLEVAIKYADDYKPTVYKEISADAKAKLEAAKLPRYYGVAVEQDLQAFLQPLFTDKTRPSILEALILSDRIIKSPHVTLVHEVELKADDVAFRTSRKALWDQYVELIKGAKQAGSDSLAVQVTLGPRIVWDSRAMSIEVSGMNSAAGSTMQVGIDGRGAHVTVGTIEETVRPLEGKLLLEAALKGEKTSALGGEIHMMQVEPVNCRGRLAGLR